MEKIKKISVFIVVFQIFALNCSEVSKKEGWDRRERGEGRGRGEGRERGEGRGFRKERKHDVSQSAIAAEPKSQITPEEEPDWVVVEDINAPTLINKIADANMQSLPPVKPHEKRKRKDKNKDVIDAYARVNQLEELISNNEPAALRQRSFAIIADAEKQIEGANWTKKSVIDQTTINDLNILIGSKEEPGTNLTSVLGKSTLTDIGQAYLTALVARPTDDMELLQKRQDKMKQFNKLNDEETALLKSLLINFGANENYLIGLWGDHIPQLLPEKDYFTSLGAQYLNESSAALLGKSILNNVQMATTEGAKALSTGLLTLYGISSFLNAKVPYKEEMSSYADRNIGALVSRGSGVPIPREAVSALTYIEHPQVRGALFTAAGYNAAKMLKTSLQQKHAELLTRNTLLKRVKHIAQLIISMEKIRDLLKTKPKITENLMFYNSLDAFFNTLPKEKPKIEKLFELLKTDTLSEPITQDVRYVFDYGRVLAATKLLTEIEEHIALPLTAIGEIDTYFALANLIKQSAGKLVTYCYPNYIKSSKPVLNINEGWNPLVDPNKVVPNSIAINEQTTENMVLTGPNSGGKSTILKSVAMILALAQSTAIVPAQSMTVTPFGNISTYMNVTDRSVGSDQASLFQAEVDRVFEYGDTVRKLSIEGKFSFAIFDEIFSGTNPQRAVELGLKVAKTLLSYNNNTSIISTHFRDLAIRLEEETQGKYKKYKVVVNILPDGRIERLFKLEPGISDQDIAEQVFKERGKNSPFFKDISV